MRELPVESRLAKLFGCQNDIKKIRGADSNERKVHK
jgi:hypothetical protein